MFGMKIYKFLNGQLFVYFQLFVYVSHISHLEASNTKVAQTKFFWNENLKFLRWSAVCVTFGLGGHLEAKIASKIWMVSSSLVNEF